jgi:hypothetical protein
MLFKVESLLTFRVDTVESETTQLPKPPTQLNLVGRGRQKKNTSDSKSPTTPSPSVSSGQKVDTPGDPDKSHHLLLRANRQPMGWDTIDQFKMLGTDKNSVKLCSAPSILLCW